MCTIWFRIPGTVSSRHLATWARANRFRGGTGLAKRSFAKDCLANVPPQNIFSSRHIPMPQRQCGRVSAGAARIRAGFQRCASYRAARGGSRALRAAPRAGAPSHGVHRISQGRPPLAFRKLLERSIKTIDCGQPASSADLVELDHIAHDRALRSFAARRWRCTRLASSRPRGGPSISVRRSSRSSEISLSTFR